MYIPPIRLFSTMKSLRQDVVSLLFSSVLISYPKTSLANKSDEAGLMYLPLRTKYYQLELAQSESNAHVE